MRGWAYYHRHVVSKATFTKMDSTIFYQPWRWIRRRHPRKARKRLKQKYCSPGKDWGRFRGKRRMPDGQIRTQMLEQAGRIPIRRHVKVLGKANPYAREDQVHFEQRQAKRAKAQAIIDEVVTAVQQWLLLADQAGVSARPKQLVQAAIDKVLVGF